jgi:EAL domain-containing protein (putative c-di-GMP-specific phosphodiesterase class I)
VVYQPIVDGGNGRVVAVEALLRQRNADGGLDGPVAPLEDAARAGMALDLDRWVLDRACRDMLRWRERLGDDAPATVHVNLAADSLGHPGLAAAVLATIDETGLARHQVRLELSERSGTVDLTEATGSLEEIAAAGVGIALDDLGASLDALSVLDRLPLDSLKIDRSVVVGAGSRGAIATEVLSLLARLADQLGLELVGEGVERRDDERTLLSAGVHLMQGFRYSHPVPAAQIAHLARCRLG